MSSAAPAVQQKDNEVSVKFASTSESVHQSNLVAGSDKATSVSASSIESSKQTQSLKLNCGGSRKSVESIEGGASSPASQAQSPGLPEMNSLQLSDDEAPRRRRVRKVASDDEGEPAAPTNDADGDVVMMAAESSDSAEGEPQRAEGEPVLPPAPVVPIVPAPAPPAPAHVPEETVNCSHCNKPAGEETHSFRSCHCVFHEACLITLGHLKESEANFCPACGVQFSKTDTRNYNVMRMAHIGRQFRNLPEEPGLEDFKLDLAPRPKIKVQASVTQKSMDCAYRVLIQRYNQAKIDKKRQHIRGPPYNFPAEDMVEARIAELEEAHAVSPLDIYRAEILNLDKSARAWWKQHRINRLNIEEGITKDVNDNAVQEEQEYLLGKHLPAETEIAPPSRRRKLN